MIADQLHSFASAAFDPVLIAICAAMAVGQESRVSSQRGYMGTSHEEVK